MGLGQAHLRVQLDMNLDEGGQSRQAGLEIVHAFHRRMRQRDTGDAGAVFVGQFAVHQLVQAVAGDAEGADQHQAGDAQREQRIGTMPAEQLRAQDGGDHGQVGRQVGDIMGTVGADGGGATGGDHPALI